VINDELMFLKNSVIESSYEDIPRDNTADVECSHQRAGNNEEGNEHL